MKKQLIKFSSSLGLIILTQITGCSINIQPYKTTYGNIKSLQSTHHSKLSVPIFEDKENKKSVLCRLAGTMSLPNDESLSGYIHNALTQELSDADLFAGETRTEKTLYGRVNEINFNSMPGSGKWVIDMSFHVNNQPEFRVKNIYTFSTNYIADTACNEVAQAYEPAVTEFLKKLYHTEEFKRT